MKIKECSAAMAGYIATIYQHLFHKRNIIIVSERKVKHVPISGSIQLAVVVLGASAICWGSYSTGSYYAAHKALSEQSLTLKSVVGNKVESNFAVLPSDQLHTPLASSKAALSSVNNIELFARIAELEGKLKESEESKKEFIEKVQQKTASNITSFEDMIAHTGLDVDMLKKQANRKTASRAVPFENQGGPYMPESTLGDTIHAETEVISDLEELAVLKQIVDNLPVRKPISQAQQRSSFGRRIDPFNGHIAFHSGLDLAGPVDSKIFATANGTVTYAGSKGAYGNMIDINHGFNVSTRYGHLSKILVEEGQYVKKGDIIGIQGSTGRSTGAHLHYEVRYKNQPMDPRNFLSASRYVSKS